MNNPNETAQNLINQWHTYFGDAEESIVFFYSDNGKYDAICKPESQTHCIVAQLKEVRNGTALAYKAGTVNCPGGAHYLGYDDSDNPAYAKGEEPNFMECFLSHGIPGQVEGECYKKTPLHTRAYYATRKEFTAPARYLVFKPLSLVEADETPDVVVFFGIADTISGLFNLANYDWHGQDAVVSPWGSGCSSIVADPYQQSRKPAGEQQGVLGMFDVSARPFVANDVLSIAFPWERLVAMFEDTDESFLSTRAWKTIEKRNG